MSPRLFPLLVTIASFSPERHPTGWAGGTRPSTAGKEVCLKSQKPVPLTHNLRFLSYMGSFYGLEGVLGGFRC